MVVLRPRIISKKTDDIVGRDQNKEIGIKLCILIGINKELLQFLNLRMDFLIKSNFLSIYMDDQYFFRYGHIRFDTNINPQVLIFNINREPVLALLQRYFFETCNKWVK